MASPGPSSSLTSSSSTSVTTPCAAGMAVATSAWASGSTTPHPGEALPHRGVVRELATPQGDDAGVEGREPRAGDHLSPAIECQAEREGQRCGFKGSAVQGKWINKEGEGE